MWKVYKRTCPNGRVYIGITSRTLEERMGAGYQNNLEFALAIREFGKENIISEVLEECDSYDLAIEREKYYIQEYEHICYNKIAKKKTSCTVLLAQSSLHRDTSTKQVTTNKRHIIPLTPRPTGRHRCPINVYDLQGTYLITYPSAKIASQELGVNNGDIISCCKGVKSNGKPRYQAKGYVFRYATNNLSDFIDVPVACKRVNQYTLEGEYLKTFNSLTEAWYETGASIGAIGHVCKGLTKSAGGFLWKYAE